ncbi:SDR family oxidoreductase [Sphingobium boeckii]|uniref:NAD(P)-dependent dehydrogenase (Short-subunit alcohol dehydrogenase family) n=1 Tax=Sphingobium boeckii TaxID=1082345 RepID=A0A7W9AEI3_9SPHN|nr:SDR family oxidoreductase [Sphingobium boeckii]MBB5684179.1 NAD(P)-dependent dehydrogenase (short-subunit alcohol dehydrogenase family) [Sphingobium boeckii]
MRKAIFITGGGSGIGRATAQLFAARDWFVGVADVDAAGMAGTMALLPAGQASMHRMDVTDRGQWASALSDFVMVSGGRLDVLFNNAGIGSGGPLAQTDFAELDRVVAINFMGVLNGARIGHAYLAKTPGSCLLNTASASAIYGSSGLATYSATKFAVRALTEALDGEWFGDGIKVRAIVPSFIETPLLNASPVGSNETIRDRVTAAGLELTPVDQVAEAAWAAVHGETIHTYVGKTAHRMAVAARWLPGKLRKMGRRGVTRKTPA